MKSRTAKTENHDTAPPSASFPIEKILFELGPARIKIFLANMLCWQASRDLQVTMVSMLCEKLQEGTGVKKNDDKEAIPFSRLEIHDANC